MTRSLITTEARVERGGNPSRLRRSLSPDLISSASSANSCNVRFPGVVTTDQFCVGYAHPMILPTSRVGVMASPELQALERDVLDGLDVADDADAPPGTRPLSAARRRRSLLTAVDLLGRS